MKQVLRSTFRDVIRLIPLIVLSALITAVYILPCHSMAQTGGSLNVKWLASEGIVFLALCLISKAFRRFIRLMKYLGIIRTKRKYKSPIYD